MKNRQRDFEIKLDQDTVFLRLDAEKLYEKKHIWNSDRHSNAEYELHIVLQGVVQVDVEDRHYSLREQQAILIAPGQYHLPRSLPGPFERFSLSFSLPEGPLLACLRRQIPSCRVFSITSEMERICRAVFSECGTKASFWQDMQAMLVSELMVHLFRLLHLDSNTQPVRAKTGEAVRTDLIDDYFEQHFAQKAGLADLAAKLHLSKRQVARVLWENYGMGFQEKLINTRMDHAAWLLRTTALQVSQIAGAVGYMSEPAFYQAFRGHFQVTPQSYRKQILSRPDPDKE